MMRTDREILKLGNTNIKELSNEEYARYKELMKKPIKERYGMKHGGKACRGRKANYKA